MTRSYRYRLLPSRAQERVLFSWLELTRELYNAALQERRDAWAKQRVSVSRYDQQKALPSVREVRSEFAGVPITIQRGALRRLELAFLGFFRRCKNGETPGFPRFSSIRRWNSLLIDDLRQTNPVIAGGKRVKIPLLGKVKLRMPDARPLRGTPKTMRLVFSLNKWYVTFACVDVPTKALSKTNRVVGVDLGLRHFAATSDGELFKNPRPLAAARIAIERAQRIVSRRKRGSHRRRVAVRTLARRHAHVAGIRREQHISLARSLVARYDTIYVEDLNVKGLARGMLAKAVHDAGWAKALGWLACKAEEAGREIVRVNPAGTSKICSKCGVVKEMLSLSERVFRCDSCGLSIDRDVNAAINIKAAGTSSQGAAPLVKGRRRSANSAKAARRPGHASRAGLPSG